MISVSMCTHDILNPLSFTAPVIFWSMLHNAVSATLSERMCSCRWVTECGHPAAVAALLHCAYSGLVDSFPTACARSPVHLRMISRESFSCGLLWILLQRSWQTHAVVNTNNQCLLCNLIIHQSLKKQSNSSFCSRLISFSQKYGSWR